MTYYQFACYDSAGHYKLYSGGYTKKEGAEKRFVELAYFYSDCTTVLYDQDWKELERVEPNELRYNF